MSLDSHLVRSSVGANAVPCASVGGVSGRLNASGRVVERIDAQVPELVAAVAVDRSQRIGQVLSVCGVEEVGVVGRGAVVLVGDEHDSPAARHRAGSPRSAAGTPAHVAAQRAAIAASGR